MAAHPHPVSDGALPRHLAAGAGEVFGRLRVIEWCEELLAGRLGDDDPAERVRIQAWMALGLPVPHEQQA